MAFLNSVETWTKSKRKHRPASTSLIASRSNISFSFSAKRVRRVILTVVILPARLGALRLIAGPSCAVEDGMCVASEYSGELVGRGVNASKSSASTSSSEVKFASGSVWSASYSSLCAGNIVISFRLDRATGRYMAWIEEAMCVPGTQAKLCHASIYTSKITYYPHRYQNPSGDGFEIFVRPRHLDLPPKEEPEEPE